MTRWVLADYGEVISDPMPAETIGELADLAGMQADEFRDRYWKFRPPYDLGQSDRAYWSAVLGHDRAENALAATALGLQAVRFTSAEDLPGQLDDWETSTR